MGNRMKVLYSLLALLCIVSTVCSDKSLGNFNGPVHGGTFNQESQKTDITANLNHGSFTGGTFIGKRAWKNRSKGKKIVMNERTVKRENLISGDFNSPVHGGTFNHETQKTEITANLNHGHFTGGTFIGKRDNKQGTDSSEDLDNQKKDKRQNVISGGFNGQVFGGTFNGKRDNKQGTDSSEVLDNQKKDKRQNSISGGFGGSFFGGTFNGKRDKSLGNFNGPVHGGTFNQETQKTEITANLNHGHFTGGTFIGKRDNKQGTDSSEDLDNQKKDKRQNVISGGFNGQ